MEKRGVPAVLVGSTEFTFLAEREREASGLPSLAAVWVPHPIGGVSGKLMLEQGRQLGPHVAALLLGNNAATEEAS